jgi:hypothetical protein
MTRQAAFAIFDRLAPNENGCLNFYGVRGTTSTGHRYRYRYRYHIQVEGLQIAAPRLALERKLGRSIAPGFQARHTCCNQSCVNPDHLVETMNGRTAE